MRVLLRSLTTNLYYGANGEWVSSPDLAVDFKHVKHAAHAFYDANMSNMEVVLQTAKPASELRVPMPADW